MDKLKDLVKFQIRRRILHLAKTQILSSEEIIKNFPVPTGTHEKNRKKILDDFNDAIRELEELIDGFSITL